MNVSFEGIGQWCATFTCNGEVAEDQMVKVSGNGEVEACAAGDAFCGKVTAIGRDNKACAVALGGMVKASYTGTAPAAGWANLSADGNGGVKADSAGKSYLVVDVDTAASKVTFAL